MRFKQEDPIRAPPEPSTRSRGVREVAEELLRQQEQQFLEEHETLVRQQAPGGVIEAHMEGLAERTALRLVQVIQEEFPEVDMDEIREVVQGVMLDHELAIIREAFGW